MEQDYFLSHDLISNLTDEILNRFVAKQPHMQTAELVEISRRKLGNGQLTPLAPSRISLFAQNVKIVS